MVNTNLTDVEVCDLLHAGLPLSGYFFCSTECASFIGMTWYIVFRTR